MNKNCPICNTTLINNYTWLICSTSIEVIRDGRLVKYPHYRSCGFHVEINIIGASYTEEEFPGAGAILNIFDEHDVFKRAINIDPIKIDSHIESKIRKLILFT